MLRVILACLLIMQALQSNARILRVGMEYPSISAANTAAINGDTIQIYGTQSGTINKRLVVIGFGYNLDVHPGLQAIGSENPSYVNNISVDVGADSSVLEGIYGDVNISASKVIIRRSNLTINIYNNARVINDMKITSCVIRYLNLVYSNFPVHNIQLYNCILNGTLSLNNVVTSGALINCVTPTTSYLGQNLQFGQGNFLVKNCILGGYSASNVNTVYERNFFQVNAPNPLPQGSNNVWGQAWANIFNRLGGTADQVGSSGYQEFDENYYILKVGSPAANAGTDAQGNPTDCGIFGGEPVYRYRISGIPAVPSIYKLTAPNSSATSNPYNVTISVRSNN